MLPVVRQFIDLLRRPAGARPPVFGALDLSDEDFIRDPYPVYAWLRDHEPVHRTKTGGWVLTRYEDVLAALSHPALGNEPSRFAVVNRRNRERYVCADVASNILPFLDGPEHVLARKIIAGAFRAHLKANPVDALPTARRLLGRHIRQCGMDALSDYGKPLSVEVVSGVMGLPESDHDQLARWSDHFFYLFAPMPSEKIRECTDAALAEFREYFAALLAARRKRPGDDFISRLAAWENDGRRLSDGQIVDTCMLLFADGIENVDAAIANTLLGLQLHPSQMRLLARRPDLTGSAVNEGLRYDSPAQLIARVAREDFRFGGHLMKKDSAVFLAFGAANRDPGMFQRPDAFDLARDASALLSFGKGRHSCLGAMLVRVQVEAALRALFEDVRDLRVDTDGLQWSPRVGHRWLTALPLTFVPA